MKLFNGDTVLVKLAKKRAYVGKLHKEHHWYGDMLWASCGCCSEEVLTTKREILGVVLDWEEKP